MYLSSSHLSIEAGIVVVVGMRVEDVVVEAILVDVVEVDVDEVDVVEVDVVELEDVVVQGSSGASVTFAPKMG